VIALLVRSLVARATEVVEWESGAPADLTVPRLASRDTDPGSLSAGGETVEFRLRVNGPIPTTYVVTVSEVRSR